MIEFGDTEGSTSRAAQQVMCRPRNRDFANRFVHTEHPSRSVIVVGTYPPTECGLATYTANVQATLQARGMTARVLRLDDDRAPPSLPVVWNWCGDSPEHVSAAAAAANAFDAVLLQHEFGIYPGADGAAVVGFVEECRSPVFSVLHTILSNPSPNQRRITEHVARHSLLTIVHTAVARARLLENHDVDRSRVEIVPHGAFINLDGPPLMTSERPILLTWGLLGPGKGIELGIEAVAVLRECGLEARYVVAGQTHPNVFAREGERYRRSLLQLSRDRHVEDLVEFDDHYRDWESLRALVRSASIVLVPYESHDQVTSGVLVEAIATGKPVVATAFPHAVELARSGAVSVVPHGSPAAFSAAIAEILQQPERRRAMCRAAAAEAVRHDWTSVGKRLDDLISQGLRVSAFEQEMVV